MYENSSRTLLPFDLRVRDFVVRVVSRRRSCIRIQSGDLIVLNGNGCVG